MGVLEFSVVVLGNLHRLSGSRAMGGDFCMAPAHF